jgi:hypothetical protein
VGTTLVRLPGGLLRGRANLAVLEGANLVDDGLEAERRGDAAAARTAFEAAHARFVEVPPLVAQRPNDVLLRIAAAVALFDAADLDVHKLGRPDDARRGFEKVMSEVADLPARRTAGLRFEAQIDLGRLALRDADAKAGLLTAKSYLEKAKSVPEEEYAASLRGPRTRLLEQAIALRSDDPEEAAKARQRLEEMALLATKESESDAWRELGKDAAEELRLRPVAPPK